MKPEKGFTKLPNSVYGSLSGDEVLVYGYLTYRQGKKRSSWWSREKIATELAMSESKVKRVTQTLTAKGWLTVHRAPKNATSCPSCGAPVKQGWAVNHYAVLTPHMGQNQTPHMGQNEAFIGVTSDLLNRTKKNNQQKQKASARKLASSLVGDEVFILENRGLDKEPYLETDLPLNEVSILDKPKEKSASERLSKERPFEALTELLQALPKEISSQIGVTSIHNDLLAQLMITQGRTLAELKIWLADPEFWKGKNNPGGWLTSQLRKQLENGYTLKEQGNKPLAPWTSDNKPPWCGECDPETRTTSYFKAIPKGNGSQTLSCLTCNPFMVNQYGSQPNNASKALLEPFKGI
jgi:hypothetical protein